MASVLLIEKQRWVIEGLLVGDWGLWCCWMFDVDVGCVVEGS